MCRKDAETLKNDKASPLPHLPLPQGSSQSPDLPPRTPRQWGFGAALGPPGKGPEPLGGAALDLSWPAKCSSHLWAPPRAYKRRDQDRKLQPPRVTQHKPTSHSTMESKPFPRLPYSCICLKKKNLFGFVLNENLILNVSTSDSLCLNPRLV